METDGRNVGVCCLITISILPIRDGNPFFFVFVLARRRHFDTSYKGWKHIYICFRGAGRPNFDTSYKGWKQALELLGRHLALNFDTSYKGWKLANAIRRQILHFYFDTSYKGWKLHRPWAPVVEKKDFDTSYKGWKHIISEVQRFFCAIISILPIRDGNLVYRNYIKSFHLNFDTSYKGWKPLRFSMNSSNIFQFRYFL